LNAGRYRRSWRSRTTGLALLALVGCGQDLTAPPPPCDDAPVLTAGATATGVLGTGDARWGGAFIQYWAVHTPVPARARISVTSTAFEPFLLLFDARGAVLHQGYDPDPAQDGLRKAVLDAALDTGCTLVGVSSWRAGTAGAFAVSLSWGDLAAP
jgi:hypothetical protein